MKIEENKKKEKRKKIENGMSKKKEKERKRKKKSIKGDKEKRIMTMITGIIKNQKEVMIIIISILN